MTTTPVTDELIAELEQIYMAGWQASGEGWNAEYPGDAHEAKPFLERLRNACGPVAAKLLAERAELKRDAERYRFFRVQDGFNSAPKVDAVIDAAMQSEAKP